MNKFPPLTQNSTESPTEHSNIDQRLDIRRPWFAEPVQPVTFTSQSGNFKEKTYYFLNAGKHQHQYPFLNANSTENIKNFRDLLGFSGENLSGENDVQCEFGKPITIQAGENTRGEQLGIDFLIFNIMS